MKKLYLLLIAFVLLFSASCALGSGQESGAGATTVSETTAPTTAAPTATPTPTPTPTPIPTPTPTPTPVPTMSPEEKASTYPKGDYDEYARNPDTYVAYPVQIKGKVIQVVEGSEFNNYRVITNDDYDQVWFIQYTPAAGESRVLEDDTVTIYGMYYGIYTYESALGASISCPGILAENMIVN